VIPGFFNRVTTTLGRVAPRGTVITAAKAAMKRLR